MFEVVTLGSGSLPTTFKRAVELEKSLPTEQLDWTSLGP